MCVYVGIVGGNPICISEKKEDILYYMTITRNLSFDSFDILTNDYAYLTQHIELVLYKQFRLILTERDFCIISKDYETYVHDIFDAIQCIDYFRSIGISSKSSSVEKAFSSVIRVICKTLKTKKGMRAFQKQYYRAHPLTSMQYEAYCDYLKQIETIYQNDHNKF